MDISRLKRTRINFGLLLLFGVLDKVIGLLINMTIYKMDQSFLMGRIGILKYYLIVILIIFGLYLYMEKTKGFGEKSPLILDRINIGIAAIGLLNFSFSAIKSFSFGLYIEGTVKLIFGVFEMGMVLWMVKAYVQDKKVLENNSGC